MNHSVHFLHRFVIASSLLLPGLSGAAQDRTLAELDDWMIMELKSLGVNPVYLTAEYEKLVSDDRFGLNCDTVHLASFLWAQMKVLDGNWDEPDPLLKADCPVKNHALHYALGTVSFRAWDLPTTEIRMRKALETSTDDFHRHVSWQGLGLVYQITNRLDSAYIAFAQSYEAAPDQVDAMGMNNLANAALLVEEYEAALRWARMAEDAYYASIRGGMHTNVYGEFFPDMVLSNRLLAEMQLVDTAAADSTFDRMHFRLTDDPMAVMMGATAVAYLLWRDREDRFESLEKELTGWLMLDSAQAVAVMGSHVLVCDPWKENWIALSGMPEAEVWDFVKSLPLEFRDVAYPREIKKTQEPEKSSVRFFSPEVLLPLATAICLAAALWLTLRMQTKRRRLEALEMFEMQKLVESALQGAGVRPQDARWALRQLATRAPSPEFSTDSLDLSGLTPRERDVFRAWASGERPKTTASELGISASAVYNLRVIVKKKLGVPEGVELEDWLGTNKQEGE